MLIAALQVKIGRPLGAALAMLQRRRVRAARIDPDIERITTARQCARGRPAGGKRDAFEDLGRLVIVPEIAAVLFELVSNRARNPGVEVGTFFGVVECRNRNPPRALAAD